MTTLETTPKKPIQLSLGTKLILGLTLVSTLVFGGTYFWFYKYSTDTAMQRIEEDLKLTLEGAIQGINGDEFDAMVREDGYQEIASLAYDQRSAGLPLPETDPRYTQHQEWLGTVHRIEPRANPYTYVPGYQPKEVLFVGDFLRISQPDNATLFLESYPDVEDMPKGFSGFFFSSEIYIDEWGSWISAYGPIKNSSDQVVGGIGIDFKADYVAAVQKQIKQRMIPAFIVSYLLLLSLVVLISNIITRPVISLTRIAEKIGEGEYKQDFSRVNKGRWSPDKFPDEIDILLQVFEKMVGKVYQREQSLRIQVERLKIQIDETKRQSQVNEIVETDFFRDLQARADDMRSRRRRDDSKK
jgi:hypothetical protein